MEPILMAEEPQKPKEQFIALCVPTLGIVTDRWAVHLADLEMPMNTGRTRIFMRNLPVDESRNAIVALARKFDNNVREISHLFWLDDDVLVPYCAIKYLYNNYRYNDIASGVYFGKDHEGPLIFPCAGGSYAPFIPDYVYEDMWGHGMGICLIRSSVYNHIENSMNLPKDRNGNPEFYKTVNESHWVGDVKHNRGTEDLYFCDLARKAGIKSIVDCNSNCFGWHINKENGKIYPEKQYKQIIEGGKAIFDTPSGPMSWEN